MLALPFATYLSGNRKWKWFTLFNKCWIWTIKLLSWSYPLHFFIKQLESCWWISVRNTSLWAGHITWFHLFKRSEDLVDFFLKSPKHKKKNMSVSDWFRKYRMYKFVMLCIHGSRTRNAAWFRMTLLFQWLILELKQIHADSSMAVIGKGKFSRLCASNLQFASPLLKSFSDNLYPCHMGKTVLEGFYGNYQ